MQEMHAPPLQTRFVPQLVPFGLSAPFTQVCGARRAGGGALVAEGVRVGGASEPRGAGGARAAVADEVRAAGGAVRLGGRRIVGAGLRPGAQEVMPPRHGSGLVAQAVPAVQEEHTPALHTRFVPQLVPFARGAAVSTHTEVPVAHEVVPATQGFGFALQETPARQVPPRRRCRPGPFRTRCRSAPASGVVGTPACPSCRRSCRRGMRPGRGARARGAGDALDAGHGASCRPASPQADRGAGGSCRRGRAGRVGRARRPQCTRARAGVAHLVRAAGGPVRLGREGVVHADRRAGRAGGDAAEAGVRVRRAGEPGRAARRTRPRCRPGSCRRPSRSARGWRSRPRRSACRWRRR